MRECGPRAPRRSSTAEGGSVPSPGPKSAAHDPGVKPTNGTVGACTSACASVGCRADLSKAARATEATAAEVPADHAAAEASQRPPPPPPPKPNTYRPTASPPCAVDPALSWELGHEAETKREKKSAGFLLVAVQSVLTAGLAGWLPLPLRSPELQSSSWPLLRSPVRSKHRLPVRPPTKLPSLIPVLLSYGGVWMGCNDRACVCAWSGVERTKKETDLGCKTRTDASGTLTGDRRSILCLDSPLRFLFIDFIMTELDPAPPPPPSAAAPPVGEIL
ncbi:uncharacterized protein LOC110367340 [Fundulus heteroclitus]|uniref:uncharacterized protein LOC110367340 n=1 Tax=Fundulus heteroclitus TaxID=8078 RepID=UPI00165ADD20|nr:uncharacterized protein LOC110367340 [Fundulus heteroclitus]